MLTTKNVKGVVAFIYFKDKFVFFSFIKLQVRFIITLIKSALDMPNLNCFYLNLSVSFNTLEGPW